MIPAAPSIERREQKQRAEAESRSRKQKQTKKAQHINHRYPPWSKREPAFGRYGSADEEREREREQVAEQKRRRTSVVSGCVVSKLPIGWFVHTYIDR